MSVDAADSGTEPPPSLDPFEARIATAASGPLRAFNRAGILSAADVHVARRLGELGGESDPGVLLAVALAVRAPRIGHVLVDLARIRSTVTVETEEDVDLDALPWPEPDAWITAVAASPLVAEEGVLDAGVRPLRRRGGRLYLDRYWSEEVGVVAALQAMVGTGVPVVDEPVLAAGLARLFPEEPEGRPAQGAAAAVRRRFAVLAGGPGTGKTTTVAKIVALLYDQAGVADGGRPPTVALTAPTGKAAARLQESVHDEAGALALAAPVRRALLELRASTIHRLLGWRPDSSSRFRHDRERRLPHDVVIVDETSMVSLSLMARLIEALRSDARLVLVGDPGQLASIEAGAVLGDIVGDGRASAAEREQAGIVVLDRGHRFGGAIAELAAAIRAGDGDAVMEVLRSGSPGGSADGPTEGETGLETGVQWIQGDAGRPETLSRLRPAAIAAAREVLHAAAAGESALALDGLRRFRVLCAHRRGAAGVAGWTARLEGWLQDAEPGFSAADRWYVGRPLLATENDYELGLNNGDTGVVVRGPGDRVVAVFERAGTDGRGATYSPSRLGAVDTVYAMTIHKSQGSQFDVAVVLLPEPGSRLLTRELLYTAATRARERLILVGPEETIRAAVARRVARASGLGERLWGAG